MPVLNIQYQPRLFLKENRIWAGCYFGKWNSWWSSWWLRRRHYSIWTEKTYEPFPFGHYWTGLRPISLREIMLRGFANYLSGCHSALLRMKTPRSFGALRCSSHIWYAIKLNSILTTEYTEHTELIRRVFLPCIRCIPWFIQYESSWFRMMRVSASMAGDALCFRANREKEIERFFHHFSHFLDSKIGCFPDPAYRKTSLFPNARAP